MEGAGSWNPRASLGRAGEDAALAAYLAKGFRLVARNWRCRAGELDLVLAAGGVLVFCEVKTRSGGPFGDGHEAVTWKKQRKLHQLAELFLVSLPDEIERVRFDVASVDRSRRGTTRVELYEDAF